MQNIYPPPPLGNLGFSTKDLHVLREIFSTRLLQCVLRAFLPNDRKQPKQFRSWQIEGRDLGGFFIKKKPPFNTLKESRLFRNCSKSRKNLGGNSLESQIELITKSSSSQFAGGFSPPAGGAA